jgi:hypothetical protein
MAVITHPDARVQDKNIVEWETGDVLPNYIGLCMAMAGGQPYIMHTWFEGVERRWAVVHEGSSLDFNRIDEYRRNNASD